MFKSIFIYSNCEISSFYFQKNIIIKKKKANFNHKDIVFMKRNKTNYLTQNTCLMHKNKKRSLQILFFTINFK